MSILLCPHLLLLLHPTIHNHNRHRLKKIESIFFARVQFTLFSLAMAPKPTNVTPGRQIKPVRPGLQGYFSSNERFKRGGSVTPPTQSGPRIFRFLTNLALLATPQAWRRVSDLSPQSRVGCEPSPHPTALPTPLPSWRPTGANLFTYSPAGQDAPSVPIWSSSGRRVNHHVFLV